MTKRLVAGASLALALVAGAALAADPLKSGPQVGEPVLAFEPRNVTGPFAPNEHCLVCWTASKPGVMILARSLGEPLTGLIKKVDAANKEQGDKMRSFVIFLDADKGLDKKLRDLAAREKLQTTVLAIDNPADSAGDMVAREADVTVVLFVGHKVKVNRAYRKGEFKARDAETLVAELPKILASAAE
jgi:hypothetical protein